MDFLGNKQGFFKGKTQGAKRKKSNFFGFPWGFYTDFLGNQMRMNFPGNRMGNEFSWESNEGFTSRKHKEQKKKTTIFVVFLGGFAWTFSEIEQG